MTRSEMGAALLAALISLLSEESTLTHVNILCVIHAEERNRAGIPLPGEQIAVILQLNKGLKAKLVKPLLHCPSWIILGDSKMLTHLFDPQDYCVQNFYITPLITDKHFTFSHMEKKKNHKALNTTNNAPKCHKSILRREFSVN